MLDLISRHSLMLHSCRFVVLDEADEMLDLGFLEDVEKILSYTPTAARRRCSARRCRAPIRALAERHLYDPVTIKVKAATLTIDTVEQFFLRDQAAGQGRLARRACWRPSARSRRSSSRARRSAPSSSTATLRDKGMNVKALHGDMSQGSRDGVMISFKGGRLPILVATDVAARGLDIADVTHIINFDIPTSPDVYVHRIGRTGRVGRSGRAITFIEPRQKRDLEAIERHAGTTIAPWAEGAHVAPSPTSEPPRRHRKPHDTNGAGEFVKLIASGGRAAGLAEADLIHAVTSQAGLDGEAVRNVRAARALRAARGPGRRGRPCGRRGERHRRPRAHAAGRAGALLIATVGGMATATLTTNHGDIVIELFDGDAPKTVDNFRKLAEDGYYDGLIFHRVIPDFMIQGGCPEGTGTGGPGYTFEDEINEHKVVRGALAMANAGPNTNGSQFFIVTVQSAPWLDGKHTVFGEVTDGMDVVDTISELPRDGRDRPQQEARIERLAITG